jgi:hypothetical protein
MAYGGLGRRRKQPPPVPGSARKCTYIPRAVELNPCQRTIYESGMRNAMIRRIRSGCLKQFSFTIKSDSKELGG